MRTKKKKPSGSGRLLCMIPSSDKINSAPANLFRGSDAICHFCQRCWFAGSAPACLRQINLPAQLVRQHDLWFDVP